MLTYLIRLDKAGSPIDFVNTMTTVPCAVTLEDGKRFADAKSLYGVMNTRRNIPVNLNFDCEESEIEGIKQFIEKCKVV